MSANSPKFHLLILFLSLAGSAHAQDPEIESLRAAIDELRADYDARIASLEQRLAVAEKNSTQASYAAQQVSTASVSSSASSAFNPAIGVIFLGNAWSFDQNPDDYAIQGFPLGGEAGPIQQGLSISETEINITANVDDKFTAWLTTPIVIEDGEAKIEIEEAWIETLALPAGFSARFGRFYSNIGYQNNRHSHTWDFADQPLPYQAFLGNQYLDDGIQLRWVAPTEIYMEFGGEVLQGSRYPAAGSDHSGFGAYSLVANIGGDAGENNSWLAGISYLDTSAVDRASGNENDPYLFSGNSTLVGAHLVWKWVPGGNWKQRNLVIQAEYMRRNDNGTYTVPGGLPLDFDNDQYGWYLQATYQPFPRWRFGGRIDGLSSGDPGSAFDGTLLAAPDSDPRRYSLMADWSNSEFSRLRIQYTRDAAGLEDDNQFGLQYIFSIGAHGAHTF